MSPKNHGVSSYDDQESIATYLQSLVDLSIQGLNTRNLSTSIVWPSVADDFTTAGMGYAGTSKTGFLEDYLGYREQYPDHRLTITGMTTTFNSQLVSAHVYTNVDVTGGHGMQEGMSRKVVVVCEFQKREGMWILAGATSLPGEGGVVE